MSCPYYWWNNHYACRKSGKDVNEDTYYKYCRGYDYSDCPIYKGADGSSSGWCFITSACTEAKGLPDDCHELTALRSLRDGYMRSIPEGEKEIREYYEVAPLIVSAIKEREDGTQRLRELYNWMVLPCVKLIDEGKPEDAHSLYKKWVNDLVKYYIS